MKDRLDKSIHKSVLLKESIDFLNIKPNGIYVDCTLGGGGHTLEIVKRLKDKGKVICFDIDKESINRFDKYLVKDNWNKDKEKYFKNNVEIILINKNFENIKEYLNQLNLMSVNGVIVDLGVSSDQLENKKRGFSYTKDGPLDMRMDLNLKVKAEDLINGLYEKELEKLFKEQDEKYAKRIAKAIIYERKKQYIDTTLHLVKIIKYAIPKVRFGRHYRSNNTDVSYYWIKPVMRVFQALRIAVNSELSSLRNMLPQALETLASGPTSGRLVVITFHSGEDRIVKKTFKEWENEGKVKILTKQLVRPDVDEIRNNLRARSAKLRCIEKLI